MVGLSKVPQSSTLFASSQKGHVSRDQRVAPLEYLRRACQARCRHCALAKIPGPPFPLNCNVKQILQTPIVCGKKVPLAIATHAFRIDQGSQRWRFLEQPMQAPHPLLERPTASFQIAVEQIRIVRR